MKDVMGFIKKFLYILILLTLLGAVLYLVATNYSYIFSKKIEGQVLELDRVTQPTVVMGSAAVKADNVLYSFAVAIRTDKGEIFSGSSEDRQWSIVQKGLCVVARFYPYPFWDLDKSGTYYNVRMVQLKDCPAGTPRFPEQPVNNPSVPVQPTPQAQPLVPVQ